MAKYFRIILRLRILAYEDSYDPFFSGAVTFEFFTTIVQPRNRLRPLKCDFVPRITDPMEHRGVKCSRM